MPHHYPSAVKWCTKYIAQKKTLISGRWDRMDKETVLLLFWPVVIVMDTQPIMWVLSSPAQVRGQEQVHTYTYMGQLMGHQLVTSPTMRTIMIVSVGVILTSQLCQGFVVLDPETKSIDHNSGYGYKIVSINGESVGESQPFKEITSEQEYSKDDVEISSLLPALKKGLKKVKW